MRVESVQGWNTNWVYANLYEFGISLSVRLKVALLFVLMCVVRPLLVLFKCKRMDACMYWRLHCAV